MKGHANKIRKFIKEVGWVVITNACYLIDGYYTAKRYQKWKTFIYRMCKAKSSEERPHLIHNQDDRGGFTIDMNYLPYKNYVHDVKLRNCVARFIHDHPDYKASIKTDKHADAIVTGDEKFYFELDHGGEGSGDFKEKLENYYSDFGKYRVIFFMASRYKDSKEQARLEKLFQVMKQIKYRKPNRILGACYTQYLKDGKVYNLRMEEAKV